MASRGIVRGQKRLRPRQIERLAILLSFAKEIERTLGTKGLDIPDLEPALGEAQHHSVRLTRWLEELNYLAEQ